MTAKRCAAIVARFLVAFIALFPVAVLGATAASEPHPALWKINTGNSTLYVLGSLHIVPPDFHWQAPEIDAARNASPTLLTIAND